MIKVENLIKTFDGVRALDNASITVPKGAVYGLVGPNGSGKSTLIRHITGVYRQDRGTVTVDGEKVYENPDIKARIANIPDDFFYFPSANMQEMESFYRGIYKTFDPELFRRLNDIFELPEKKSIRTFSKGMQKQAAFRLAISCRPDYLILDEPVDGLDPVMRKSVWSLMLSDVAKHGTTVLVSSHNLRELEDVCDHVGILEKGKTVLERNFADLAENITKVQLVMPEGTDIPEIDGVIHREFSGRMNTLIIKKNAEELDGYIRSLSPAYYDLLPLSLEEIFIYELGGMNDAIKEIIL